MMKAGAVCLSILALCYTVSSSEPPSQGYVPDAQTASAIAQAVLVPIYGKEQVWKEWPYTAKLDGDEWTVMGSLNCGGKTKLCAGGVAVVQLSRRDGSHSVCDSRPVKSFGRN